MKITFFLVPGEHPKVRYQHEFVSLAEGLKELCISFNSNYNYWFEPKTKEYLLQQDPDDLNGRNSDIHVYNTYYFNAFPDLLSKIDFKKINIFIDREDGLYSEYANPIIKKFNLVLRAQFNKNIRYSHYNKNIVPWAFGLSNRIINTIDTTRSDLQKDSILKNFRIGHSLREYTDKSLTPLLEDHFVIDDTIDNSTQFESGSIDQLYYQQSGKRHNIAYYERLNQSKFTYSFGGIIHYKPFAHNRIMKGLQHLNVLYSKLINRDFNQYWLLDQYDSWRWWECLYSDSCPIHHCLEDWGWELPVLPVNYEHYIGIEKLNFSKAASIIIELGEKERQTVAKNGSKWVAEHYSPVAIARRFIDIIGHNL